MIWARLWPFYANIRMEKRLNEISKLLENKCGSLRTSAAFANKLTLCPLLKLIGFEQTNDRFVWHNRSTCSQNVKRFAFHFSHYILKWSVVNFQLGQCRFGKLKMSEKFEKYFVNQFDRKTANERVSQKTYELKIMQWRQQHAKRPRTYNSIFVNTSRIRLFTAVSRFCAMCTACKSRCMQTNRNLLNMSIFQLEGKHTANDVIFRMFLLFSFLMVVRLHLAIILFGK